MAKLKLKLIKAKGLTPAKPPVVLSIVFGEVVGGPPPDVTLRRGITALINPNREKAINEVGGYIYLNHENRRMFRSVDYILRVDQAVLNKETAFIAAHPAATTFPYPLKLTYDITGNNPIEPLLLAFNDAGRILLVGIVSFLILLVTPIIRLFNRDWRSPELPLSDRQELEKQPPLEDIPIEQPIDEPQLTKGENPLERPEDGPSPSEPEP